MGFVPRTILKGRTSHKDADSNINPLLKMYYTNKPVLFTMCAANESFYMLCYLYHFTSGWARESSKNYLKLYHRLQIQIQDRPTVFLASRNP
jgi:hypothetical protein